MSHGRSQCCAIPLLRTNSHEHYAIHIQTAWLCGYAEVISLWQTFAQSFRKHVVFCWDCGVWLIFFVSVHRLRERFSHEAVFFNWEQKASTALSCYKMSWDKHCQGIWHLFVDPSQWFRCVFNWTEKIVWVWQTVWHKHFDLSSVLQGRGRESIYQNVSEPLTMYYSSSQLVRNRCRGPLLFISSSLSPCPLSFQLYLLNTLTGVSTVW